MKANFLRGIAFGMTLAGLSAAWAGNIDQKASNVTATFTQMGVPVPVGFKKFDAQIDYDPANAAAAKARIDVDVASFDMGDPAYNAEVQKKEWFNTAQFPKATFVSSSIKATAADKLVCAGQLTIKGRTLAVSVPVTIRQQGKSRVFEGTLPIKRLDFNVGEGEWKATDMLIDEVRISFKMVVNG